MGIDNHHSFHYIVIRMSYSNNTPDQEMLSPLGVSTYLNISIQTVYRYLNGEGVDTPMPSYKFSKKNIRVRKSELDLWVAKNLNNSTVKNEELSKGGEQ